MVWLLGNKFIAKLISNSLAIMWLPGTFLNQSSDTKIKVKIGQNLKIKSTVKGLNGKGCLTGCGLHGYRFASFFQNNGDRIRT